MTQSLFPQRKRSSQTQSYQSPDFERVPPRRRSARPKQFLTVDKNGKRRTHPQPSALWGRRRKGTAMVDENRQIESQKNPGSNGRRRPIVAKVRQVENQRRIAVAPDNKQAAEWRA
jgi:hypothetical protein